MLFGIQSFTVPGYTFFSAVDGSQKISCLNGNAPVDH